LDKESSFEKKNTKECFDAARENQLWLEGTSSASTVVFLAMSRGFILLVGKKKGKRGKIRYT